MEEWDEVAALTWEGRTAVGKGSRRAAWKERYCKIEGVKKGEWSRVDACIGLHHMFCDCGFASLWVDGVGRLGLPCMLSEGLLCVLSL